MTLNTLWYTRCPVPSAQTVAINLGWLAEDFAPDGIAVRSLASSHDPRVHLSHYTHSQPDSFRFGGVIPPLVAASRGADLRIIGLGWVDRSGGIYALPGGRQELRGARLGVPRRLNDETDWWRASVLDGYTHALAARGLDLGDVTLVDIAIARRYAEDAVSIEGSSRSLWGARSQFAVQREEVLALARGEIDGLYTDGAIGALARAFLGLAPLSEVTSSATAPATAFGAPVVLTVSGNLLDARPDIVDRWVARLLDAREWAARNALLFQGFGARDSGVPEELFEDSYSSQVAEQMDVTLDARRLQTLQRQYEHLLHHQFIEPFDLASTLDAGPLRRAQAAHSVTPAESTHAP